jgi:succinyl-diaminopimelate desuccinylase
MFKPDCEAWVRGWHLQNAEATTQRRDGPAEAGTRGAKYMVTKNEPLEIARELVRIESMNPPGHENECTQYVGNLMQDAGLQVSYHEFAEGRTSVVARLEGGGAKAPICFGGHIDTVPLGAKPWSMDPFAGEVSEGKLYGRGSTDMKAGVAAYLWTAIQLARRKRGKADILFIAVAGEETGCQGSLHLAPNQVLRGVGALLIAEPTSDLRTQGGPLAAG